MPTTLTDVAQIAWVSIVTASQVLTHSDHPVNSQTRQRVLQIANELGYRPHLIPVDRCLSVSRVEPSSASSVSVYPLIWQLFKWTLLLIEGSMPMKQ